MARTGLAESHCSDGEKSDTARHSLGIARGRAGTRKYKLSLSRKRFCFMEEGATWAISAAAGDRGTNVRHESQQNQPGRKGPMYEDVLEFPVYATVSKPKSVKQDDSIHYADIQVFTKVRERSAAEVKNLQMQNATEYATLNFPRPRLKYDSKNGTLV
uniref:Chromosome 11 open reading frame 52 n=2 Tax=Buteo TaxID=30396 RepID=A0A8C0HJ11_9AVES